LAHRWATLAMWLTVAGPARFPREQRRCQTPKKPVSDTNFPEAAACHRLEQGVAGGDLVVPGERHLAGQPPGRGLQPPAPAEDVAETGHAALAADALHLDRLLDGGHRLLSPDAVDRPACGDPCVVRGRRAELLLVADDARVATHVARLRRVPEQVRVV